MYIKIEKELSGCEPISAGSCSLVIIVSGKLDIK